MYMYMHYMYVHVHAHTCTCTCAINIETNRRFYRFSDSGDTINTKYLCSVYISLSWHNLIDEIGLAEYAEQFRAAVQVSRHERLV